MTPRILALDLGSKTGWAINDTRTVISGTWDVGLRQGESFGMRFIHLRSNLNAIVMAYPDLKIVYYEKGLAKFQVPTAILGGYVAKLTEWCEDHQIEYRPVAISVLKKYATGRGNASKVDMMEAARRKGWTFEDDNECDALWLLDYGRREIG